MQDVIIQCIENGVTKSEIRSKLITADNVNYYCKRSNKSNVPQYFSIPFKKENVCKGDTIFFTITEKEKIQDVISIWEPDDYTKWRIDNP